MQRYEISFQLRALAEIQFYIFYSRLKNRIEYRSKEPKNTVKNDYLSSCMFYVLAILVHPLNFGLFLLEWFKSQS